MRQWGRDARPIVALLTDYGTRDAYAGVLAGAVLRQCPDAQVVTITHEVPLFDIAEGSYLLARAAGEFPIHVVFVAVVDPGVGTDRRAVVARTRTGHLFVAPDNGLLTGVIRDLGLDRAWEITNRSLMRPGALSRTFHGRDIFGPIGGRLAGGMSPENVGRRIKGPAVLPVREAKRTDHGCTGQVLHVDYYGNVITNIPADWLAERCGVGSRKVTIEVGGREFSAAWVRTYADVEVGELAALASSEGRIEIARNRASAAEVLGARAGTELNIRF